MNLAELEDLVTPGTTAMRGGYAYVMTGNVRAADMPGGQ
jgi:hypothetical protein